VSITSLCSARMGNNNNNPYVFTPVCDFLDLKSFLEVRKTHRTFTNLHHVRSVYEITVWNDAMLQKLLLLTGKVATLPVLRIYTSFTFRNARSMPHILQLVVDFQYHHNCGTSEFCIPSDVDWIRLENICTCVTAPYCKMFLSNLFKDHRLRRLDLHFHLFSCVQSIHIDHPVEYLSCTDLSADGVVLSFRNVTTFDYLVVRHEYDFPYQRWPANRVILRCEEATDVTLDAIRVFGVQTVPTSLEVHLSHSDFKPVLCALGKNFPSVKDITVHLKAWIQIHIEMLYDIGFAFSQVKRLHFLNSENPLQPPQKFMICHLAWGNTITHLVNEQC
jgi:hypothetical protein